MVKLYPPSIRVGLGLDVDQHTPLCVIDAPPSDKMFPPDTQLVSVIFVIGLVVIITLPLIVEKEISFP